MYNYRENVREDIENAISERMDEIRAMIENGDCLDEIVDTLNDWFWVDDSVTGNASGSYTFNSYTAEENLCHNWDLLKEALNEFGSEFDIDSPEVMDVTIRCYLLGQELWECIEPIYDQICEDLNEANEE